MPCKKAMEKLMKVLEAENDARMMCVDYGICPDCGEEMEYHRYPHDGAFWKCSKCERIHSN